MEGAATRATLIRRSNLFEVLDQARRVTMVCAPAGAGKTSLIRSWVAATGHAERTAWVSIGRRERDPQVFWLAVLEALRHAAAGPQPVIELPFGSELNSATIVDRLMDELAWLEEDVWLVVDDLHELNADEAIEAFEELLARAPAQLKFVLLTRRDLHLGLHRLRLEDEVTEIRGDDLRFTVEESRVMLDQAGVKLSDDGLGALVEVTEGWAAGLRLAVLLMARERDPEQFAASFSGRQRTVAEYLLAEVLQREAPEVSRLLLRTSILDRVSGPLADRLTGDVGSERILLDLETSGAFVVALDPERSWFRYHHLFSDLLLLELRRTAPEEVPQLHAAAAGWFAEHDQPVEAISHAQAAEEWELAAQLLADHWFGLHLNGRRATIIQLLSAFPAGMALANPELAVVAAAMARSSGSFDEAEQYLSAAAAGASTAGGARHNRFLVALSFVRLSLARTRNDLGAVAEEAQRLIARGDSTGDPAGPFGCVGPDLRTSALIELGIAEIWTGRYEAATQHLDQALTDARKIGRPRLQLRALAHRALASTARIAEMETYGKQALDLARAHGWEDDVAVATANIALGAAALIRGQLRDAEVWLDHGSVLLADQSRPAPAVMLYALRGMLELARNRPAEAIADYRIVEQTQESLVDPHMLAMPIRWSRLRTLVRLGETGLVEEALAAMDDDLPAADEMHLVSAELSLEQGDPESAIQAIERAIDHSVNHHPMHEIQARLLEAITRDQLGDAGGASRALELALDLAEPEGILLPFFLLPAPELLDRHTRLRSTHISLIAEIQNFLTAGADPSASRDVEQLAEPLSESELRVLRYLPTNMRGPEIAAELFVSLNTIRTHLRHLYAKLDVHDRSDAVVRARELGLLAPSSGR